MQERLQEVRRRLKICSDETFSDRARVGAYQYILSVRGSEEAIRNALADLAARVMMVTTIDTSVKMEVLLWFLGEIEED